MDTPRGRIYLMREVFEGRMAITESFVKHMDLCLLCRNCETACPSGVKFGFLMEAARENIEGHYHRPLPDRWFRSFILHSFTHVTILKVVMGLLRIYQRSGIQKVLRASGALMLLGRLGEMESLLPTIPKSPHGLPEIMQSRGKSQGRVGLLLGCVQRYLFPEVNRATARVLNSAGYDIVVPGQQGCCGSLLVHEGGREQAKTLARKTIDVFESAGVDLIAVNAAGCGSVMKEYWQLLQDDPFYMKKAEAFSAKVRDVSEIVAGQNLTDSLEELNLTATYHSACHLAHGQMVREEPRSLLRSIPGLNLMELEETEFCCGSAGIYNLLHPELSQEILQRKIQRIKDTGAEVVVSGNPGCSLQLIKGLKQHRVNVSVVHPVELMDRALGGKEGKGV